MAARLPLIILQTKQNFFVGRFYFIRSLELSEYSRLLQQVRTISGQFVDRR